MKVTTIEDVGVPAWDSYVESHKEAGVYHLSIWKNLLEKIFNSRCHYLIAVSDKGDVCGVLPLIHFNNRLFGNFIVSMPYFNHGGVLSSSTKAGEVLLNRAIELAGLFSASHIELREFHPRNNSWQFKDEKILMCLDLPNDPDVLWKSIGAKRRSQVKRSNREGASVKIGGIDIIDDFYSVFSCNMRDLGTPVYTKRLFKTILEAFPEKAHIIVVYVGDVPAAAAFLIGYRQTIEIPWASSARKYNRFGVNMKLYWEVLKFSILQGYNVFDFGRSTIDGPTYKFKKQWGAEPRQCYWNYWLAEGAAMPQLNPNNAKYKIAIEGWKKLPLIVANTLGPAIVKNLP